MSNRTRKKLHHHNHNHHHNNNHHHHRAGFSYIIILVIAAISLFCITRHHQSSMINYTAVAATAFNMPKIGLGTMSIRPSEAAPVIVSAYVVS